MFKSKARELAIDLIFDIIGSMLFGAGLYTFAYAADFAPGGVSGLAIILNYFTDLPIGVLTLILNVPILLISYKFLGNTFLLKSLKTMVIMALFLDVIFPKLPVYTGNDFLAALFAGALVGAGMGLIFLRGSSTGGSDFLVFMCKKKWPHLSLGQITIALDGVIIAIGALVFGRIDAALYGVVMTAVTTVVIDKIMNGAVVGKMAFIITDHPDTVAQAISDRTDRGSTIFDGKGAYTGKPRKLLLCACSKAEIVHVRRAVYEIDPKALVMITDYSEVFGEGFQELKKHS
ncbi:MAG: YitT family protein [Oscillospiraceae bacterium]